MAYDSSKLVNLGHLKDLAERVKTGFATQAEYEELAEAVEKLQNEGSESNVIEGIKVNGVTQEIIDKIVDITVPTKTSELENDSDFQDADQVQEKVDEAVAALSIARFEVVDEVPTAEEAEENVLYLVMNEETETYDIYALIGEEVICLGDTGVDLDGYVKATELAEELANYYTKEEIDEELEDVLREPDIADDEDVNEMLDEVLGEES